MNRFVFCLVLGMTWSLAAATMRPNGFAAAAAAEEPKSISLDFDIQELDEIAKDTPQETRLTQSQRIAILAVVTTALFVALIVAAVTVAGLWKVFTKAGKPGWAAVVPIYNVIVIIEIIGRPIWWILLCLVPCVNIAIVAILMIDLAKSFGKDVAFGIGLWLLGFVFLPILGFGSSQYRGPAADTA